MAADGESGGNVNGAGKIGKLFLSATVTDLHEYRYAVRDAIRLQEVHIFLQEDWPQGAMRIVPLCEMWVKRETDAYCGIFGYRYGWIPDGGEESITHLECRWAFERWSGEEACPVFLFLPERKSEADVYLQVQSEASLEKEFPGDAAKRDDSKRKQEKFLQWLRDSGRRIQFYTDKASLQVHAITAVNHWNRVILESALRGRKQASRPDLPYPPAEILGSMDNGEQREVIKVALKATHGDGACPGCCLLIQGGKEMGQFEFLSYLEHWFRREWDGWKPKAKVHEPVGLKWPATGIQLLGAAFAQIAPNRTAEEDVVTALAKVTLERCRDQAQVLRFRDIDTIEGGLAAFYKEFWLPLFDALRRHRHPMIHKYPLVVTATISVEIPAQPPAPPNAPLENNIFLQPAVDTSVALNAALGDGKLIPLPALRVFGVSDVCDWLKNEYGEWLRRWLEANALEGEVVGEEGRKDIAMQFLAGNATRNQLFERLRNRKLWNEAN
jgi:hypothetical protein